MNATVTAPVTITTAQGSSFTVQMPTTHYTATEAHTQAVIQVAEAPAADPAISGGAIAGLSGAGLVGLGLLVWTIARWKHVSRDHHSGFVKGIACAILLSGFGLFSILSNTVIATGNSTGSVVTNLTQTTGR